jgi:hypothetical protein
MIDYNHPPAPIVRCIDCNQNEKKTLEFLQNRGIKDKNALATVMGNIKQESMFKTKICEGGFRTSYHGCRYGGFGLIQWTTSNRYYGLGSFCRKFGCNPNTIEGQLRYMVNENQWANYERKLKIGGKSIGWYMNHAYYWLGWGIHGNRTNYAYDYRKRFKIQFFSGIPLKELPPLV